MKVIQKTTHLLKLSNRPELMNNVILWSILYFFMFGLPTLGLFLSIPVAIIDAGVERFSCKKVQGTIATCELSKSSIMGLVKGKSTFFEGVNGTRVEKITDTDAEEVFLVTNKGNVPLPNPISEDVKLFDKYIQTAVGEFVIEKDNRLSNFQFMLFQVVFSLVNVGVIYFVLCCLIIKTYIFDKNASTLIIKRRGIRVNEVAERSLHEISEVKLETTKDSDGDKSYKVHLVMDAGDSLCLSGSSNREDEEKMADLIRSYVDARSTSQVTSLL